MTNMKVSAGRVFLPLGLALFALGVGFFVGAKHPLKNAPPASETSFQQEMDAYCTAKLNELNADHPNEMPRTTDRSFFSRKLHTCLDVGVTLDPKDAGAMNYLVSDLTYGFIAPPKWHAVNMPLHVSQTNYGSDHHLYATGYWASVSSDPSQKLLADANAVELTCDYTDGERTEDQANSCTETTASARFGGIKVDTQTFHIASWRYDEVIATGAEQGILGSTTSTLLIHPEANEIEVVDRTRMHDKLPESFKGAEGNSAGGHYELRGGVYLNRTQGALFQCDEDGVVIDMRTDVAQKHHGDVMDAPESEWNAGANAGAKADHKFTQQECNAAMQKKLRQLQ